MLTNGGGPGILVSDACEAAGLLVPLLSLETQAALRDGLPPEAAAANPVDMIAAAGAADYGRCLRILGAADEVDAAPTPSGRLGRWRGSERRSMRPASASTRKSSSSKSRCATGWR